MTFSYAPEPTAPEQRKTFNGVGLAALIVGVLAFIGSFIPLINYGSGFVAVVGIVLGIIGLVLKNRPKGMALAGLITSVVALIVSIVLAIVYTAGLATAIGGVVSESQAEENEAAAREVTITYELTGTPATVNASWTGYDDAEGTPEQVDEQALPFTQEYVVPVGTENEFASYTVTGSSGSEGGDLTCRILVDGVPVVEQTGAGAFSTAICVASSADVREAVQ
jgi:hypothetical protein